MVMKRLLHPMLKMLWWLPMDNNENDDPTDPTEHKEAKLKTLPMEAGLSRLK